MRRAIFNTSEDPETLEPELEKAKVLNSFAKALRNVGRFPHLREVELKFARLGISTWNDSEFWPQPPETLGFRTEVLQNFFLGLNDAWHPAAGVDSLTVKNLQDWVEQVIYEMPEFAAVLGRLKKLHPQVATEYDYHNSRTCP